MGDHEEEVYLDLLVGVREGGDEGCLPASAIFVGVDRNEHAVHR